MARLLENKIILNGAGMIFMLVLVLPAVTAQIAVQSFSSNPEKVLPGNTVDLNLLIENVGNDDIENVVITLDLIQVPFAPLGSSSEKVLDEIEDDSHENVHFTLQALPNAEPAIYKIPVIITYNGASATSIISVEVSASPHLDLIIDHSEAVSVNNPGKVTVKFVNNGLTQVKFLKVTLQGSSLYDIISSRSLYIGEVDVGDFETEEFTLIPRIENPILTLDLEYRDAANHQFKESKLIQLPVYTEEKAQQLGLIESNGSSGIAIIIGIVALLVIVVYRKMRRKKNHES